ncbi:MAG: FkbM family methyltransferase, partial [Armatimonadetes bacterium]|nr:FkbM family methyltransferase [Armatimonadota bacterium]
RMGKERLKSLFSYKQGDDARSGLLSRYPAFDPSNFRRVALIGAATWGAGFVDTCSDHGIDVAGVFDSDPGKQGRDLGGKRICPVEALSGMDPSVPIVIASHRLLSVYDQVKAMGFQNVASLAVLSVLDPVRFQPHPFYDGLAGDLITHHDSYESLYDLLSDEKSRVVLDALIGFRMTLSPDTIRGVIEPSAYFPEDIVHLGGEEVFVDGGAYSGDTIDAFVSRTKGRFRRILAFEPDPDTYRKLAAHCEADPRILVFNEGLYSRKAGLRFAGMGQRDSMISDSGPSEISVTSLDSIPESCETTFMKLNIEGCEEEALHGAGNLIRNRTPKLAIAVYHRPSDLWKIPSLIHRLNSSYSLYLRQHDGGIIESVLYALNS